MRKVAIVLGTTSLVTFSLGLATFATGDDTPLKEPASIQVDDLKPSEAELGDQASNDDSRTKEEDDSRLAFLTERLLTVEAMLEKLRAQQVATLSSKLQQQFKSYEADQRITRNLKNGGAPIGWKKFYGRTSNDFYKPGGRAIAVLNHANGRHSVVGTEGAPVMKKRPAQFDYVMKGEKKAKSDADQELAKIGNKKGDLDKRREELELEQLKLWTQIAFRDIRRQDMIERPTYRFEPMAIQEGAQSAQRVQAMREAILLMTLVLTIVEESEQDRMPSAGRIETTLKDARLRLRDTWMKDKIVEREAFEKEKDPKNSRETLIALTRKLENCAGNFDRSYVGSIENSAVTDPNRLIDKMKQRKQLYDTLEEFPVIILAMDETVDQLAKEWQVQPNVQERLRGSLAELLPAPAPPPVAAEAASVVDDADDVLEDLTGIKIQHDSKVAVYSVNHVGADTFITRQNGTKVPLTQAGNKISWRSIRGGEAQINVDSMTNQDGHAVELVYGVSPSIAPTKAAAQKQKGGKRKRRK